MPAVEITIDILADTIKRLNKVELETLSLLISGEGQELLKRKEEIEDNLVNTLTREEVFDV